MTPVERILAAAGLQPVDRPPVLPVLLQQGARMLNMSLKDYFETPKHCVEGQTRLIERFGHDAVYAIPHVVQDTLPWGAGLNFHDDGAPSVNKMVINRYEEIQDLVVPDPTSHPYLRHTLRTAEGLARRFKGDRLIVGAVIGPFSLPTLLMGTGKFMALMLRYPKLHARFFKLLLEKMMVFSTAWANAQFDAGCDVVVVADGITSATILQEKTFLTYALPVIEKFIGGLKGLIGFEFVGDAMPFIHHVRDLPVAVFLTGSNDNVVEIRKKLGPQKAIMGNINNLKMLQWKPERVEFEARKVISEAGPGFLLSNQGPEIPFGVTDENIDALIRAAIGNSCSPQPARAETF